MKVEPAIATQPAMKKSRREKMNALLGDFLTNSSMHGLKYIAQTDRNWVERFIFLHFIFSVGLDLKVEGLKSSNFDICFKNETVKCKLLHTLLNMSHNNWFSNWYSYFHIMCIIYHFPQLIIWLWLFIVIVIIGLIYVIAITTNFNISVSTMYKIIVKLVWKSMRSNRLYRF